MSKIPLTSIQSGLFCKCANWVSNALLEKPLGFLAVRSIAVIKMAHSPTVVPLTVLTLQQVDYKFNMDDEWDGNINVWDHSNGCLNFNLMLTGPTISHLSSPSSLDGDGRRVSFPHIIRQLYLFFVVLCMAGKLLVHSYIFPTQFLVWRPRLLLLIQGALH